MIRNERYTGNGNTVAAVLAWGALHRNAPTVVTPLSRDNLSRLESLLSAGNRRGTPL